MAKRTGMPTSKALAYRLCRILAKYQAVIILAYPSSPALHAAVSAAMAACEELKKQIAMNEPVGV
jgi:hypothetical protein